MFFKDTKDFKEYLNINVSFKFEELSVYLKQVDNEILLKYLGQTFLLQAQTAYNNSISVTNPQPIQGDMKDAVEFIRKCTPFFALIKWIPFGQVMIDSSGIRIANTAEYKTAFQWQINDLKESLNESGISALDDLLGFLESKITAFQAYQGSDEYKSNNELFVSSSSQFVKYYSLMLGGRSNYFRLKSIIRKVEDFEIKSVLLPNQTAALKNKLQAGTALNADEKKLMDLILPAVVNLTIAKAVNEMPARLNANGFLIFDNTGGRETMETKKSGSQTDLNRIGLAAENDGRAYVSELKELLDGNLSIYTAYANDPLYKASSSSVVGNADTDGFYTAL